MIRELEALSRMDSWSSMHAAFGAYLGMAVPPEVLRRALDDDQFAHYLMICKGQPTYLAPLISDPKNQAYVDTPPPDEPKATAPVTTAAQPHSTLGLVARASGSFLRWGASGFSRVERAVVEQRYAACTSCPELRATPDQLLYKIMPKSRDDDGRVCNACGCPVVAKGKRATERCPVADPDRPGHNRWGQAIES
jgi:hypothetical protein